MGAAKETTFISSEKLNFDFNYICFVNWIYVNVLGWLKAIILRATQLK